MIAAGFVAAFLTAAVSLFGLTRATGAALGLTSPPVHVRVGVAGAALLLLAAADVRAVARGTYCPIGCRRQTPRALLRRHPWPVAAVLWGFDTGLVVTTFRVAAVSWAALLLSGLGLAPWWTGFAYGVGFALPFAVLLLRPGLGRCASQAAPSDPGLEAMLRKRGVMQAVSAALLVASGAFLIGRSVL